MTAEAKDEKYEKNQQSRETDGFKFAVVLLAALGSISYTTYDYLQYTAVDIYWYEFFCGIIAAGLILIFGLLLYIFIKGVSLEVLSLNRRENLEKWASHIFNDFLNVYNGIIRCSVHFLRGISKNWI